MAMRGYPFDMILSELADAVGEEHVSIRPTDLVVYSTDWSWMPQMWLDRGQTPVAPDVIVHPGSPEEIARGLKIANVYRLPVVPCGRRSRTHSCAAPPFAAIC